MAPRNNAAAQRERERQQRERERQQRERQQREAQQRAQREAQQRAQRESQQRAQREAQQRAKQEADRRAKQQAQQKAKQDADRKAKQQQQQKGKQQGNVKAAIRQAETGGITRKELQKISKQTGASNQQIVKRMDAMNKAGRDVRLNAGAANTIIKQAQKTPYDPFGRQPSLGTGNIARALQGMIGTPGSPAPRNPNTGADGGFGGRAAVPGTGLMAGGMQIRKGGRPAVMRQVLPAAPAKPAAPASVDTGDGTGTGTGTGTGDGLNGFDFASFFDGLFGGMEEPMMPDMPSLESFAPISADVQTRDPLQLAALGQSYASDMIRAKQRQAQGRRAYMRGGQSTAGGGLSPLAALLSIGGLTL